MTEFWDILDIYLAYSGRNWKQTFALCLASQASSFEYPHVILLRHDFFASNIASMNFKLKFKHASHWLVSILRSQIFIQLDVLNHQKKWNWKWSMGTMSSFKFKIHNGPIEGQTIFVSEVCHVGTQNLKLQMLITMQKSIFNFELPSMRKCPVSA